MVVQFSAGIIRSSRFCTMALFPYFTKGQIVKGFGRGSKELGIPTANFPDDVVSSLPKDFDCGIYYGWAKVDDSPVYGMVMSVGWNPHYKNTHKTMETHVLHAFNRDLYGAMLKVCVVGYIRDEKPFESLDALITAIQSDITEAKHKLDQPENHMLLGHEFFRS